jgi:hypothetical protein
MYGTRVNGAWVTDVVAGEVFLGTDLDIAVDAQGVPHISYHAYNGNGIDELRYATRVAGVWNIANVDATNDDVGKYNAIDIDSQGRPHVTYYNETQQKLKYAVKSGIWMPENADENVGAGTYGDMVLDSNDRPHVVYHYTPIAGPRYATKNGNWEYENIGGETADYLGIALTPAGQPVLHSKNGGYVNVFVRDSLGFDNIGGFTSAGDVDGALAIDNEGTMHLFFQSLANNVNDLSYLQVVNNAGSPEPAVQTGPAVNIGEKCDIAVDQYGNPLGVYFDATHFTAYFIDSGVRLSSALAGANWPVGGERTITWRGAGSVNVWLSTNGGASYDALALNINNGGGGGSYTFTVPHQPSRFCKIKLVRTSPYSASVSDSLFTIEGSVALLNLTITPSSGGTTVAWATNPGPADLSGYRVDRRRDESAWTTLVPLTRETTVTDAGGRNGDEYRLFAINRLGEELLLGSSRAGTPSLTALAAYPNPFSSGQLTVDFATVGGLGGGAGQTTVAVYDVAGRLVRTLTSRSYPAGMQRVTWDGRDGNGASVSTGVYFVRSVAGTETNTQKILVVR